MKVKPTLRVTTLPNITICNPSTDIVLPNGLLRLKSIERLSPPADGSSISVYVRVADEINANGPYNLNSSNQALLNIDRCLQNSLTLSLFQSINSGEPQFVNRQTVSITDITSLTPLQFLGMNETNYLLSYEIIVGGCA
ncbi:hypothetical protein WA1_13465 [Scytonema hofmannii PCC 7110]|uniref:Uncharacterized protein n=1 Tax=Scytonema hofmannii PCC 7110 TaxID=128403 RepID=A0A139XEJ2_9CYAN|nr:hypothetical protein [Scytonema hofmannii]KYC43105.1 hypothetical protein WA1_13465 [Scytonema hofmannii PCC 7110]